MKNRPTRSGINYRDCAGLNTFQLKAQNLQYKLLLTFSLAKPKLLPQTIYQPNA